MNNDPQTELFGPSDRLLLHQLQTLEALQLSATGVEDDPAEERESAKDVLVPSRWELLSGVELYDWQRECLDAWVKAGGKGTVKVVTGAGKTILALALAQHVQREVEPELRVAVVAPTIALMNQWYQQVADFGAIPTQLMGRMGGGYDDDFSNNRRLLFCVLASAADKLADAVERAGVGEHLLLVADECHQFGSETRAQVFETTRRFSLGLSATPEREDSASYDTSVLGRELGSIVYELTLHDAFELGIIPRFRIQHYALPLTPAEQNAYDRLSRAISESNDELRQLALERGVKGGGFFSWVQNLSKKGGASADVAARYLGDISRRDALLYGMAARRTAAEQLIEKELENNSAARIILFHERITEVNRLFLNLQRRGTPVVLEHSQLSDSLREQSLNLFRSGVAQVIVSARSLIEGFDVPAVDVGIVAASSSSVRQRVQSLGRMLRRYKGPAGEEQSSLIHVLYGGGTKDEAVYGRLDWNEATGVDRNFYYHWNVFENEEPVEVGEPPRRPLPRDVDLTGDFDPGDVYPGAYEGDEYRLDSAGNMRGVDNEVVADTAALAAKLRDVKGAGGRFRVTPSRLNVLVRVPAENEEGWVTLFVDRLTTPLAPAESRSAELKDVDTWVANAAPGDEFPFAAEVAQEFSFRKKMGGRVARPVPGGGMKFALMGADATDPARGADAEAAVRTLRALAAKGKRLTELFLTPQRDLLFRENGKVWFILRLEAGFEFVEDE